MRAFYHTDDLDQAQREMRQNQARAAAQRLADRAAGGERAARDGAGRQAWWSRQNTIDLPSPDAPGSSFGRWLAIHLGLAFGYMFLLTMVCTRGLSSLLETPVPDGFWAKAPTFLAVWLTAHLLLIATPLRSPPAHASQAGRAGPLWPSLLYRCQSHPLVQHRGLVADFLVATGRCLRPAPGTNGEPRRIARSVELSRRA